MLGLLFATHAHAGELLAARFRIQPERPYVGQPFELHLEVEVTPGAEIQDLQLEGISLDAVAKINTYQKQDRRQIHRGDATVDVLPFVASGRATQPVRQDYHVTLHAQLVERYTIGFFSSLRSSSAAIRMEPLRLTFRALPIANVPPGFQGAIGAFTLTGQLEPAQAAPGDIVNLTGAVTGKGWLGNAQIILPPSDPNFRTYPPQETSREETGALTLRQVIVPLNTNATRMGMLRLPYFDPTAGIYREATAGPFQLNMSATPSASPVPAVKHLDVQPNPSTPAESGEAAVVATIGNARHLLPFAGVLLLAMSTAGLLYGWRPRLAIPAGIIVFTAGLYLCQQWSHQTSRHGREVRELVAARLCPSPNARILFHISPSRQVTPVEASEEWVRVDADGRYGWIPAHSLKP